MTSERMREIVARHSLSARFDSTLIDLWLETELDELALLFRALSATFGNQLTWPRRLTRSDESFGFCDLADFLIQPTETAHT